GERLKDLSCVEGCHVEKYTILAREAIQIWEKYCGDNVPEATTKKYLAEKEQFRNAWGPLFNKCYEDAGEVDTPEEDCKLASDCIFGSALNSAKTGISNDVVRSSVILNKINFAATQETSYGEYLPSSCNFLFVPNVPELYPYEPYQPYEYYQPEPYYRNPYQRNPYQRNPYQRNSYQRNSYQRNPYKRRN
ncbi:hypothetical protein AAVH_37697, partial [Aphelenchoides avenae]